MSRLALNKSSLNARQRALKNYLRFLPSLELKRRQLIAERERARREHGALGGRVEAVRERVARLLPMAAWERIDLDGIVAVESVRVTDENVVGTVLPVLEGVELRRVPYGLLSRPHWVEDLAEALEEVLRGHIEQQVASARLARLEEAVTRITQRVNLFDKVLIPGARSDIHRIRIHLADAEREAVVRAKLAKRKATVAAAARDAAA